jgi:hypothetical protein
MTTKTLADRLAALEKEVQSLKKQLKPTEPPPVVDWWVKAYPVAYRNRKESNNG